MPALPLVPSGSVTLLVYILMAVGLAALGGAVIGFLADRRAAHSTTVAEPAESPKPLRKAA